MGIYSVVEGQGQGLKALWTEPQIPNQKAETVQTFEEGGGGRGGQGCRHGLCGGGRSIGGV